jgi:hypothetical protein
MASPGLVDIGAPVARRYDSLRFALLRSKDSLSIRATLVRFSFLVTIKVN